ncbi:MAG TPA: mucoidy inhibitor MuiA family protein [bacterium]|nr:mucoidy inhibitor MuiA family protein [bacterium]HQP97244.1 mucoidy inhibitor MuiA family protein [bacterium]
MVRNRHLVRVGVWLILLVLAQRGFADRIIAESTLSKVVVYRDRAMLFREAEPKMSAGTHRVLFPHLPTTLLTDSLRVSTVSDSVKVLGVSSRLETLDEQKETKSRQMRNQLRYLQDDLQVLLDREQTLTEQIGFYRSLGESAGARVADQLLRGSSNSDDWQTVYQTLAKKITEIRDSIRELTPSKRELEEKIATSEEEIRKLEENITETYEVAVDVEVSGTIQSKIAVSYVAQGAGWSPIYDVRYLKDGAALDIIYGALVHQRTGEPWTDVQLILSTERPQLYGRPKELSPWAVGIQPASPKSAGENPPAPAAPVVPEVPVPQPADSTSPAPGTLFEPKNLGRLDLEEDLGSVAVSFQIPSRETVPSGDVDQRVTIASFRSSAKLQYEAIPRQSPYTFLRAVMTNDSQYPLLSGKANIFFGNDFLSTSSLDTTMPGTTQDFYLGSDPEIEVRRTELERTLDSSGLILTTGQQINWVWELEVNNRRDSSIVLEVVDQVPVPRSEGIELSDFRCRDQAYNMEKDGVVRWVLELGPGENRKIRYSYRVKFPRGVRLSGLEG